MFLILLVLIIIKDTHELECFVWEQKDKNLLVD